jgi:3-hydroxyacyl-[acyl-carrier-protein] dehydratase
MNRQEIEQILPHRPPMLLLDEVDLVGQEAHGRITIRGDEYFLQGHFPHNPVVPGVIICEMLAQNCCVLLLGDPDVKGATPYYTSLDKVRFKHPVHPGDTLELTCRLRRKHGSFRFTEGEACVDGKPCCSAQMSFALMPSDTGGVA